MKDWKNVARAEREEFAAVHEQRRFLVARAAVLGVATGAMAIGFRLALESANHARAAFWGFAQNFGAWGLLLCILWSATLAGAGVWLVSRCAPEAAGGGIPHLKGVLLGVRTLRPWRVLWVKFVGGTLALGAGMVLGRQGPTLQMGGAVGALVAQFLRVNEKQAALFVAAGAAAGLSASFNAPLAGLIFVLEEVQRDFSSPMFVTALMAALVADVISRLFLGQHAAFAFSIAAPPSLAVLPVYVLLGVVAGVLGVAFNRGLLRALDAWPRRVKPWQKGFLIGALLGATGFWAPGVLGGGQEMIDAILSGQTPVASQNWLLTLPLFMLSRAILTLLCCSTGAPGGFFLPLLSLGAQLGLFLGLGAQKWAPHLGVHPPSVAAAGMAALLCASVRAPLTSLILVMEMTNAYALILPLLTACLVAYGVAEWLRDLPIYEALLERDLERNPPQSAPHFSVGNSA